MQLSLNSGLDIEALRARFQAHGRVQIRNVLEAASAERVYRCLTEETQWVVGYKEGEKSLITTEKDLLAKPPEERQKWIDALYRQAAHDFQFLYYCLPLEHEGVKQHYAGHFLYRIYDFIRSEPMLSLIRTVTGIAEIKDANSQATWYRPNNFLTLHDDMEPNTDRRVAYVLNFSKDWRPDWGGYLQFFAEDGNIEEAFMPSYNTLNLFRTPMKHSVSFVTPFCAGKRLALTGWYLASSKNASRG